MRLFVTVAVALMSLAATAGVEWHDADTLPLLGKCIDRDAAVRLYQRVPDSIEHQVKRPDLYMLGCDAAGMAVRFRSDAPAISVCWTSSLGYVMDHMPSTGTRGLDFYVMQPDSSWTYIQTARPSLESKTTETLVVGNMDPVMREYLVHLSLYDGVDSLSFGIPDGYRLEQPAVALPVASKPVIWYGTSITQGGCANRPGMAASNILRRRLNRDFVNLGFSGSGQLDTEIARIIAGAHDPGLVILDFVPNVNEAQIDTLFVPFVEIIKAAHPSVPILVIEDPDHPTYAYDTASRARRDPRRKLLHDKFDSLAARFPNMHYLPAEGLLGYDREHTVDALHFTDMGFMRYADSLQPVISKILDNE